MIPGKKGQMGPLGEDLIPMILAFLSLVILVLALNHFFVSQLQKEEQNREYAKAQLLFEKKRFQWSQKGKNLLLRKKICSNCEKGAYQVKNMENDSIMCSCGGQGGDAVVSFPVAIKDGDRIISGLLTARVLN